MYKPKICTANRASIAAQLQAEPYMQIFSVPAKFACRLKVCEKRVCITDYYFG